MKWRLLTPLAGTTFNTNNGVFSWRPAIAQSPTTNLLSVSITDNGLPLMSATQNFTVIVQQPQQPLLGPPSLTNGAMQFSITGDAGPDYLLQTASNLLAPADWQTLFSTNSPTPPFDWSGTLDLNEPSRFFRVKLAP